MFYFDTYAFFVFSKILQNLSSGLSFEYFFKLVHHHRFSCSSLTFFDKEGIVKV